MRIASVKTKALKRALVGDATGIKPSHLSRLTDAVLELRTAAKISDLARGLKLHSLNRNRLGGKPRLVEYAVSVNGPWRLVFSFDANRRELRDLQYVQYH